MTPKQKKIAEEEMTRSFARSDVWKNRSSRGLAFSVVSLVGLWIGVLTKENVIFLSSAVLLVASAVYGLAWVHPQWKKEIRHMQDLLAKMKSTESKSKYENIKARSHR